MKRRTASFLACALLAGSLFLNGGTGVGEASAFLTSRAGTSGYAAMDLSGTAARTEDEVSNWKKHVAVTNTGTADCKVRVRFLVGTEWQKYVTYVPVDSRDWEYRNDGYWYYNPVLEPGRTTSELLAELDSGKMSNDMADGGGIDFNVIVCPEYARVLRDANGNPYADWNEKLVIDRYD